MASRLLFLERDTRRPVAISNESTPATATDAPSNCDDPAPGGIGTVADHGPPLAVSKSRLVAGLNSEASSIARPVVSICLPTYNGAKYLLSVSKASWRRLTPTLNFSLWTIVRQMTPPKLRR